MWVRRWSMRVRVRACVCVIMTTAGNYNMLFIITIDNMIRKRRVNCKHVTSFTIL